VLDNIYTYATNTYTRTAGNIFDTAESPNIQVLGGNIYVKANGNIFINSNANIAIQSVDNIFISTGNIVFMNANGNIQVSSGGNLSLVSSDNMLIQTSNILNVSSKLSTYMYSGNTNIASQGNICIVSNDNVWVAAQNAISILAINDDIIVATNKKDLWLSSENKTYMASEDDTTIHTGGMLAIYVHKDKKLEKIEVEKVDEVVPDIEPLEIDVDPVPELELKQKVLYGMWAHQGVIPIQPTDITQEDNQINGPGQYSSVTRDTILYKLPFHEPYNYHSGALLGTDGAISESSSSGTTSGPTTINPYTGQPILLGSIVPGSNMPMPLIGTPRSGMQPGIYTGNSYTSSGQAVYNYIGPSSALAPGTSYQLSSQGTEYLIGFEGYSPLPYTGVSGSIFVGVAHALTGDEISNRYTNTADGDQVPWEQGLSDDQIMGLLQQDLYQQGNPVEQQPVAQTVQQTISAMITQAQFDVLVDFCWNITPPQFQGCDVVQAINSNNFDLATNLFLNWSTLSGSGVNQQILARRMSEASRFRGVQTIL
jgi:GH24 family phage-related lysozyme (muramidase)/uncharacterized protein (DUF2345 family)